jgi:hypothetical protein
MNRELDPSPTATDPADNRPRRGATTGARSPQPYFDRLAAAVERLNTARSLSRQLQALAEEAPTITNDSSPTSCSRWPTGRGRCRDAHCTVRLPLDQVIQLNAMATVDTTMPTRRPAGPNSASPCAALRSAAFCSPSSPGSSRSLTPEYPGRSGPAHC